MFNSTKIINLNVPLKILRGFDHICKVAGKTRTTVLVDLMRNFVLDEGRQILKQSSRIAVISSAAKKSLEKVDPHSMGGNAATDPIARQTRLKSGLRPFSDTTQKALHRIGLGA